MAIKFREIIQLIENDGWYQVRQKGSYRQFKHDVKTGIVTIAYHSLKDPVPVGTLSSIQKQAQLER